MIRDKVRDKVGQGEVFLKHLQKKNTYCIDTTGLVTLIHMHGCNM